MPGPGKKQKAKTESKGNVNRPAATTETNDDTSKPSDTLMVHRTFADDIDNVKGWNAIVDLLCVVLDLPDMSTRNGYKKIHKDFPAIYGRLNNTYNAFSSNDRVVGGVVGIYAKMSADTILRDRLFEDNSLLPKIIALLDRPACCHVVLQALSTITVHSGQKVRLEIAKKTPALLKLLEEQPDDAKASELSICIIAHTVSCVLGDEVQPDAKLLKMLDMSRLLRNVLAQLRKPSASIDLVDHALRILVISARHCEVQFAECAGASDFLVACSRGSSLSVRCAGVIGVMRLKIAHIRVDRTVVDPQRLMATAQKRVPDHLVDAIMDRGSFGDMIDAMLASRDYQDAMSEVVRDHDFVRLGRSIGELVLRTELSVTDGMWQSPHPRTGRMEIMDVGLGFTHWLDALPRCAAALRTTGVPGEIDIADIVELKFLVVRGRFPEAHVLARRALARNSRVGFFYYVLTLGVDKAEGLRYAKKGLKCPNLTDYVRYALLFRAAEHALNLGLAALLEASTGNSGWDEGMAFILSAWEDTKAFMENASPDAIAMKTDICMYIILTFVIKGSEIGPDLKELQVAIEKLKIAYELNAHFGRQISKTQTRLAWEMLLARTSHAAKQWDADISRICARMQSSDANGPSLGDAQEKAEDYLAAWLDEPSVGDDEDEGDVAARKEQVFGHTHRHGRAHAHHRARAPEVPSKSSTALYRCAWCNAPSAILKKCSGCEKARYCDAACQKEHWRGGHKKVYLDGLNSEIGFLAVWEKRRFMKNV
ncbi:hypothetical protein DFH11DRAFT_1542860 [Phellopilus nigrolimitatus]|nr:hypothetical protein DFH11DRAFT_1542860 [Phellopilus nigrolimitatus]